MKATENFHIRIEKAFVHKQKEENVFIANVRRSLDRLIDARIVEEYIPSELDSRDVALVKKYYQKASDTLCRYKGKEECYILANIPFTVPRKDIHYYFRNKHLSRDAAIFFTTFYKKKKNSAHYELINVPSDSEELKLIKLFKLKHRKISDLEKTKLSDILEGVPYLPRSDIFFSNVVIDTTHPYYFEHYAEHLPGMMIVEACRQFITASCHKYGKVPLQGYNFILSKLNIKFNSFVELNFPVSLEMRITELFTDDNGIWNDVGARFDVVQKEKSCAEINLSGSIVSNKVFKRMRKERSMAAYQPPRFKLRPHTENLIEIRDQNNKYISGKIEDISQTGFRLRLARLGSPIHFDKSLRYDFIIYFEKIGFIHGSCMVRWQEVRNDLFYAGFIITDIEKKDRENLAESLKQYGYAVEERTFV